VPRLRLDAPQPYPFVSIPGFLTRMSILLGGPDVIRPGTRSASPLRTRAYTRCQKSCPIRSVSGGGNAPSLRVTQSRQIFVQGLPATCQTHDQFSQNFWQPLYNVRAIRRELGNTTPNSCSAALGVPSCSAIPEWSSCQARNRFPAPRGSGDARRAEAFSHILGVVGTVSARAQTD
jgi:hypothetical protein